MKDIKKMLCLMMLLIVTLPATSQSLKDYIRSRAGNADSLVWKAVSPALSIIRQQYRLERNGDFYGKNKRPFYGETYTLGVKISNYTLLQRGVILPWENDADYKRVNAGGKYTPVYFRSMQRPVNDSVWKATEFDFGTQFTKSTSTDSLLFLNQDKISDFGLSEDKTEGAKQGYMIWAYSTTNLQDSAMQVKFSQTALNIEAKANSDSVNVTPGSIDNVLGGIYVAPQVERAGYIKLLLVGVAVRNSNNEWKLELRTEATDEPTKSEKPRKRKKESKEEQPVDPSDDSEPTPIK